MSKGESTKETQRLVHPETQGGSTPGFYSDSFHRINVDLAFRIITRNENKGCTFYRRPERRIPLSSSNTEHEITALQDGRLVSLLKI